MNTLSKPIHGTHGSSHSPRGFRFYSAVVFAGFLFSSGSAHALTLTNMQDQVRRNVRDTATDTTLQRYSNSLLTDWINEAQRDFFNATWCVKTSTEITTSSGTLYYSLPDDFVAVEYVIFTDNNDLDYELKEVSEKSVIQKEGDYENTSTGASDRYFVRYSTSGGNAFKMAFFLYPVTSTSTGTARVSYYEQPTDLSSGSDVPFEGHLAIYPYHDAIIYYATARIKILQGLTAEAEMYFSLYERSIESARKRLNSMPNYSPSLRAAPR